jgi:hypothetical protein
MPDKIVAALRQQEYDLRLTVEHLRRQVFQQADPSASTALWAQLKTAEEALAAVEKQRIAAQAQDPSSGLILDTEKTTGLLGAATTGLEAKIHLRMAQVPTAIYHLFDRAQNPLVSCEVRNASDTQTRRLRVTSYIDGYSAQAVDTVELAPLDTYTFDQLPVLDHDRIRDVTELRRATLNILVEALDAAGGPAVELHRTEPVWLLARTTAPVAVEDPKTGKWQDLSHYFGAFVTPNVPSLMSFLRLAAGKHPGGTLAGYQGNRDAVTPQVQAIFTALKEEARITYVNSVIDFNPDLGSRSQRVRLPRESLAGQEANCIDGTVLFASLLEGSSLNPAIVLVPGHAFLAWETWPGDGEARPDDSGWHYLETTMIGSSSFEEACASADKTAEFYRARRKATGNPLYFNQLPLRLLRTEHNIMPME